MTNLTVSTDHFDPSVHWPRGRTKGDTILDCDESFVLVQECISRPTALISCTHSVADRGKLSIMAYTAGVDFLGRLSSRGDAM
jgi:hypothetical protein